MRWPTTTWASPICASATSKTLLNNTSRAIELDPDYRDAYHNRGLARSEVGDLDLALADFNRAIDLDPDYWPAYRHRSVVHHLLGNADASYRDFLKARELETQLNS